MTLFRRGSCKVSAAWLGEMICKCANMLPEPLVIYLMCSPRRKSHCASLAGHMLDVELKGYSQLDSEGHIRLQRWVQALTTEQPVLLGRVPRPQTLLSGQAGRAAAPQPRHAFPDGDKRSRLRHGNLDSTCERSTAATPRHASSSEQAPGFPGDKSKHKPGSSHPHRPGTRRPLCPAAPAATC